MMTNHEYYSITDGHDITAEVFAARMTICHVLEGKGVELSGKEWVEMEAYYALALDWLNCPRGARED
ncbi:MAG TPA: hypothetical protein VFF56_03005 [Bacillota bacterium]|nr:hypothetical protein [Bacillota bacterium]